MSNLSSTKISILGYCGAEKSCYKYSWSSSVEEKTKEVLLFSSLKQIDLQTQTAYFLPGGKGTSL